MTVLFSCLPLISRSTFFPYTTLFRSSRAVKARLDEAVDRVAAPRPLERLRGGHGAQRLEAPPVQPLLEDRVPLRDRKSTRLNSSHSQISYAVFCLKKKIKYHDH